MLIGEVARRSGVSARMLRHYDRLGLVRPTGRTQGGYREYAEEDIRRIFHIESLRSLGLSLREAGRALDDPGFAPAELVDSLVRRTRERLAAETELLTRLTRIDAAEPAGWDDVLHITALLQALSSEAAGRRQRAALSAAERPPVPVDALAEAALHEADPHVAGALRWALARSGDAAPAAPAALSEGLRSPEPAVRLRAVHTLAEFDDEEVPESTALLHEALTDHDLAVRGAAALTLGPRGAAETIPTLVELVTEALNDVDAADALATLAEDPTLTDTITHALLTPLTTTPDAATRRRLTQALADIPGTTTTHALSALSHDPDPAVAHTATYLLHTRTEHSPPPTNPTPPAPSSPSGA